MRISAYRYKNHQLHNNFTLSVGAPDTTYTGSCNLKTAYPGCLRPGYSVTRVLRSRYHVSGVLRPGHAVSAGSLVPSEWPTIRRRIYIHVLDKQLHTMVNTYYSWPTAAMYMCTEPTKMITANSTVFGEEVIYVQYCQVTH